MSIYNKTPLRQWGESDTISTMRFGLTCFMFFALLCVAQARRFDAANESVGVDADLRGTVMRVR